MTVEPWSWKKVEQPGLVTEWTLEGPDVLCRYWYDKPPSKDANLIAAAPVIADALIVLLAELHRLSVHDKPPDDPKLNAAVKAGFRAITGPWGDLLSGHEGEHT